MYRGGGGGESGSMKRRECYVCGWVGSLCLGGCGSMDVGVFGGLRVCELDIWTLTNEGLLLMVM